MTTEDPVIRCDLAFSDLGLRNALRAGAEPQRRTSQWVGADESAWTALVALLPTIAEGAEQRLVVNSEIATTLKPMEPLELRWSGVHRLEEPITVLPLPRFVVQRGNESQPLDEWPATIDELVELVSRHEQAVLASLEARVDELRRETMEWADALPGHLAETRVRFDTWTSDPRLFNPDDFIGGEADDELAALGLALDRLSRVERIDLRAAALVPIAGGAVPSEVFLNLPDELTTAALALEQALRQVADVIARADKRQRDKEAKAKVVSEAAHWVTKNGSPRLRKALDAGLLDTALGAYRDERLALEHPGWMWLPKDAESALNAPVNPSETLLDALSEARRTIDRKSRADHDRSSRMTLVTARFLDRRIWRPDLDEGHWEAHLEWLAASPSLTYAPSTLATAKGLR